MSDFEAKMHQIRFRLGLCPRPRWGGGAYSAPPDPPAGFNGPTSKGREGKGGKGRGKEEPTYKGREVNGGKGGEAGEGREKDGMGREGKWRAYL